MHSNRHVIRLKKNTYHLSGSAIATFMLIFLSSGFLIVNDILSSSMTIALWLATFLFLVLFTKSINIKSIVIVCGLLFGIWLSVIMNGENKRNAIMVTFSILTMLMFANVFSLEKFTKSYIDVVYFLSVISLIGFALFSVVPGLRNYSVVTNAKGFQYTNLFFYIHPHSYNRNMGIFWEPGAFQMFIGLAMLLEILKEKARISRVLIFVAAIITTYSTTGYIALALILLLMLFQSKAASLNLKVGVGIITALLIIAIFVFQDVLFATAGNTPFGKLVHFFSSKAYLNSSVKTSTSIRFWGIVKGLEAFWESPVWGWGYEGLQEKLYSFTRGINTCTFINWFAVYGGLYGFLMLSGLIGFTRKMVKSGFMVFMVLLILFVLTISENMVNNVSVMILAVYGFMPLGRLSNENYSD